MKHKLLLLVAVLIGLLLSSSNSVFCEEAGDMTEFPPVSIEVLHKKPFSRNNSWIFSGIAHNVYIYKAGEVCTPVAYCDAKVEISVSKKKPYKCNIGLRILHTKNDIAIHHFSPNEQTLFFTDEEVQKFGKYRDLVSSRALFYEMLTSETDYQRAFNSYGRYKVQFQKVQKRGWMCDSALAQIKKMGYLK